MAFKMMSNPARDMTPEHTKRAGAARIGELHPDISAAYDYVDSVIDAAIAVDGHAWHGWSMREAFLAGISHAKAKP